MSDIAYQVFMKKATITYLMDGDLKRLFTLPKNAIILSFLVDVDVAFNDTGSDLLKIGITGDDDHYALAVDLSALGQTIVQQFNLGDLGVHARTVNATYDGLNSDASAGSAKISCIYAHYKNR